MKFRKNPERRQKGRSFKTKSKLEALTESTSLSHKQTNKQKKNETIAFFLLFFFFCQSKLRMKSQEKKGGNTKKKKNGSRSAFRSLTPSAFTYYVFYIFSLLCLCVLLIKGKRSAPYQWGRRVKMKRHVWVGGTCGTAFPPPSFDCVMPNNGVAARPPGAVVLSTCDKSTSTS